MSLHLMKKRVNQSGITLYDEQIKDSQDILAYSFQDDVSFAKMIFFWIPGDKPRKGNKVDIKFYNRKYSSANGNTQEFLTKHTDKIEVGDYIYNEKDDTYWLCTESFNVDDIHYKGKFTQCNWYLKWQRNDGTILEYPCQDLNSTQYNSGESGNSTLKLGSAQHIEIVQATPDTISIATPQRFYISRNHSVPYIVTQNDTTASNYGKGLCRITVTQDENRPEKDRPDLGICDYKSSTSLSSPDIRTSHITIEQPGNPTVIAASRGKIFTAKIYDFQENEIVGKVAWNLTCLPENENYVSFEILADNSIRIQSKFSQEIIGTKVLLEARYNNISESIYITIGGGI